MIRAKFKVVSKTYRMGSKPDASGKAWIPCATIDVKLAPVFGNGDPNHENTRFWQASPTGEISIGCANAAAADAFVLGQEYYVDFTPSEAPAA